MEKYPALFEHSWAADSVENWISFSADDTLQISSDATEKESSESSVAQQEISQDSPSIIHQCIDHKKVDTRLKAFYCELYKRFPYAVVCKQHVKNVRTMLFKHENPLKILLLVF